MNYTLKLTPNWEENLRRLNKNKKRPDGRYWENSDNAKNLRYRIKELYKLSGNAEIVEVIK